jgi:hypothetical protein
VGPVAPVGPVRPIGPCGPVGPVRPGKLLSDPAGPVAPVAPVGPITPVIPYWANWSLRTAGQWFPAAGGDIPAQVHAGGRRRRVDRPDLAAAPRWSRIVSAPEPMTSPVSVIEVRPPPLAATTATATASATALQRGDLAGGQQIALDPHRLPALGAQDDLVDRD